MPKKAKAASRSKSDRNAEILWTWVGEGKLGAWLPQTLCEKGWAPYYPPRPGEYLGEMVKTPCISTLTTLIACAGGWCEYNPQGQCISDRCRNLGGGCRCPYYYAPKTGGTTGPPANTITPCALPVPKAKGRGKGKGKAKRAKK